MIQLHAGLISAIRENETSEVSVQSCVPLIRSKSTINQMDCLVCKSSFDGTVVSCVVVVKMFIYYILEAFNFQLIVLYFSCN